MDPIENRYRDEEARAQATRDMLKCITDHRKFADSLPPQDKELVHLIHEPIDTIASVLINPCLK